MKNSCITLFNDRYFPLVLLFLTFICYGLFFAFQGFIMDDWYLIWYQHTFGSSQFPQYFSLDRPLMGYFYMLISPVLMNSESPIIWHILALICRWLVSYSLWGFLNTLWPDHKRQNMWVCLLAVVYPGFMQHWVVVIYSFFYACLAGFFLSMTLMIKAIQNRRKFWLIFVCSLLLSSYSLIAAEFFTGIELIRVIVIWIVISRESKKIVDRIKSTIRYWSPYLAVYFGFIIWRTFFYSSVNHSLSIQETLSLPPLKLLRSIGLYIYNSVFTATIKTWESPFDSSNYPASGSSSWIVIFIIIVVFFAISLWQFQCFKNNAKLQKPSQSFWKKEAFCISIFSLLLAFVPFWASGLTIDNVYPNDRFLLAYLFGSCLLVVSFFEILGGHRLTMIFLISILVASSAGFLFIKAKGFKNIWEAQKSFYWQIVWRMPGIEPGTALMAYRLPDEQYYSGHALTAQLNWTYSDSAPSRNIDYQFLLLNTPQFDAIPSFSADQNYTVDFRTYRFSGNTDQSIFLVYEIPGCLRVVDSKENPLSTVSSNDNDLMKISETFTDLTLINSEHSTSFHPPYQVLGKEPEHNWCYYFEKAELAFQERDYQSVRELYQEAIENGYFPNNSTELYPFIKSFILSGEWDTAHAMTLNQNFQSDLVLKTGLCKIWGESKEITTLTNLPKGLIDDTLDSLGCGDET